MPTLTKRLAEIEALVDDILAGAYPQRSAIGPGGIQKNFIRSKTITSSMIDVSNLQAVSAQTGNLNVDGEIVIESGGAIRQGLEAFDDLVNSGFWLGDDGGTPKILIGSQATSTSPRISWNGSALSVLGEIKAETGYLKTLSVDGNITVGTSGAIRGGKTSYVDTTAGWWIGYSSGYKLVIGNSSNNINWDGSTLTINGTVNINGASTFTGAVTVSTGSFNMSGSTPHIRSGQTGYDTGTGFFLGNVGGSPRMSVGNGTQGFTWNGTTLEVRGDFIADTIDANAGTLGGLTVDGGITLTTSGRISAGASSITAGTGFWIEYNAGTPRFRIGQAVSAGNDYLYWNGSALIVAGRLEFGSGDYLENDLLHFEVSTSATKIVEAVGNGVNPVVYLNAHANSFGSRIEIQARESAASGGGQATIAAVSSTSDEGYWELRSYNQSGNDFMGITANYVQDGKLHLYNLNTGAGADIEAQLGGTGGSEVFEVVNVSGSRLFGIASNGAILIDSDNTNGPLFLSGGSGALPNPTKYLVIRDGDNDSDLYYVPVYMAANAWAA